jgi:hypothetical protein
MPDLCKQSGRPPLVSGVVTIFAPCNVRVLRQTRDRVELYGVVHKVGGDEPPACFDAAKCECGHCVDPH